MISNWMSKNISNFHKEILDEKRQVVFSLLKEHFPDFILGGGTAIALQLNNRKSYDFDFFLSDPVPRKLLRKINEVFLGYDIRPSVDSPDELSLILNEDIKISFVYFPFPALHDCVSGGGMKFFDLRDLASNKAYAIGRRGVWRDYVDMFFLIKSGLTLEAIIFETKKRFGGNFDEKLFLEQLVYFNDLGPFDVECIGEKCEQKGIEDFFIQCVRQFLEKDSVG